VGRILPPGLIGVKFCLAKRMQVLLGCAKFHVNQCNELENADFWPVSKFNTGSLQLCGNPAGNDNINTVV